MAIDGPGAPCPPEVMLLGGRWDVAYPLSTRHGEALMEARGVEVAHSPLNRGVLKYSPPLEEACHRRKRAVGGSGRMEATSMKGTDEGHRPVALAGAGGGPTRPAQCLAAPRAAGQRGRAAVAEAGAPPPRAPRDAHPGPRPRPIRPVPYFHHSVAQEQRAVHRVPRPMVGC
jgi:putative transposase